MKLLRHEIILFVLALSVLSIITCLSISTPGETIDTSPQKNAVPYLININTADADELTLLDGIGPKLAEKIIDYRTKNGMFTSVSDLCKVSGIGDSLLESIKEFVTT